MPQYSTSARKNTAIEEARQCDNQRGVFSVNSTKEDIPDPSQLNYNDSYNVQPRRASDRPVNSNSTLRSENETYPSDETSTCPNITYDKTVDSEMLKKYLDRQRDDDAEVKRLLSIHLNDIEDIKRLTEELHKQNNNYAELTEVLKSQTEELNALKAEFESQKMVIKQFQEREGKLKTLELFDIPIGEVIEKESQYLFHSGETKPISLDEVIKKSVPSLIGFLTTEYKEETELLKMENESLKSMNEKITNDIKLVLQDKFQSISSDLNKNLQNLNIANETKVNEKFDECKEMFNELENVRGELLEEKLRAQKLESELKTLKGDKTDKLTFENLKHPIITSDKYHALKLDLLEKYDMVQLQNIVKRTSIELGLAVDCLEVNIPRLTVLLGLFSLLLKFTVWLSEEFLDVDLDFHKQVGKCIDIYLQSGDKDKAKESFQRILHRLEEIAYEQFDLNYEYDE